MLLIKRSLTTKPDKSELVKKAIIKRAKLFKGSTITEFNSNLIAEYQKHNITDFVIFNVETLKNYVKERKDFTVGLLTYLSHIDNRLNEQG